MVPPRTTVVDDLAAVRISRCCMGGQIRILHLSDLHAGMAEHRARFQHLRAPILADLKEVLGGEPVHLVVFTGDLTQRGVEFEAFQQELSAFVDVLTTWTKHRPVALAVPGNHDLERPDARDRVVPSLLKTWDSDKSLREGFWSDEKHFMRKTVDAAFAKYSAWWRTHSAALGPSAKVQHGVMPGDFSASVTVEGVSVGVVGLNSAFLQLTDDQRRSLDLDVEQVEPRRVGRSRPVALLARAHAADDPPSPVVAQQARVGDASGMDRAR
ncbi:MAG: metallophosphoesterase [Polyangiales bacterium]